MVAALANPGLISFRDRADRRVLGSIGGITSARNLTPNERKARSAYAAYCRWHPQMRSLAWPEARALWMIAFQHGRDSAAGWSLSTAKQAKPARDPLK